MKWNKMRYSCVICVNRVLQGLAHRNHSYVKLNYFSRFLEIAAQVPVLKRWDLGTLPF